VVAWHNIKVQRVSTYKIGYDVFDVEPNVGAGNGASNVTFDNNTIHTYYLSAYSIVENAPIANQSFTNNRVIGRGLKITAGVAGSLVSRPNSVTISGNSSDTAQSPAAMNLDNIDSLAVTGNTVPMADGTMAAVDSSCKVNISGNSFPGGSGEYLITNLISSC
jgi:hypothetical protein